MNDKPEVGQTVYLYNPRLRSHNITAAPVEARIVSVGRTLVELEVDGRVLRDKFRIDTGRENNGRSTAYTPYFLTETQQAEMERRAANDAVFRAARLNLFGSKLTDDDKQAIADLLRSRGYGVEEES